MDRLREAGHRLQRHGDVRRIDVHHGHSVRASVGECDVIMLMLPDAHAVEAALFSDGGLAATLPPGRLLIDLSHLSPADAALNAARVAGRGGLLVDAPVSGAGKPVPGPAGNSSVDLSVDLGGDAAACARAEPLLRLFAARVERAGGPGEGQRARLTRGAERDADDPDGLHRLLRLMAFDEPARSRASAG
ncbi:NAD(P)-binding domain-containing protein [Azospirillum sp. HJ39]|uniref:NAD(P)-binding domain-containing protein n=1 Tax=Azospirillum sp. HJ39 TaxID=3159496 RepID=UPI00355733FC